MARYLGQWHGTVLVRRRAGGALRPQVQTGRKTRPEPRVWSPSCSRSPSEIPEQAGSTESEEQVGIQRSS
eukprot:6045653-Heterocapsa_arctica.AAC.1